MNHCSVKHLPSNIVLARLIGHNASKIDCSATTKQDCLLPLSPPFHFKKAETSLQHVLLLPYHHQSIMAQQLATNESTPLLSPDLLHHNKEQQVEGGGHSTSSTSLSSNTITQPSVDAPLSSPNRLSAMMQIGDESERMPLALSGSPDSATVQQHEEREFDSRASFNSPRVDDDSTPPFFSGPMYPGTEEQHEHSPSLPSTSGKSVPSIERSVGDESNSNIITQQARTQQYRSFSLSDPTQSSIMLRRNGQAESASVGGRSFTSQKRGQNVNPERLKQLISTLGLDDQRSALIYQIVMATAPFHNTESQPTPPAPEESNPQADALHESFDSLTFTPSPPAATPAEEDSVADNTIENPTGNLLFDADASDNLGSHPIEPHAGTPPLLWSSALAEDSLDPNAENPTYYTVAEFVNTIIEKGIQVESVTEDDWLIEELRVTILNRLREEDAAAEEDSNERAMTTSEVTDQGKSKKDASKSDLTVEGESDEVVIKEEATEHIEAKDDTSESKCAEQAGDSEKSVAIEEEAIQPVETKDDINSNLQRWKEQGPSGWLKRDDGTDMNEEEVDEECERWDAMVRRARHEKETGKAAISLDEGKMGDMLNENSDRSSPMRLQSLDLGEKFDSVAEHIKTMGLAAGDSKATVSDTAKTSEPDAPEEAIESPSQKWKQKALGVGKVTEDEGRAEDYGESFPEAVTSLVGDDEKEKEEALSREPGLYTPSVYSEQGKKPSFTAKYPINMIRRGWGT